MEMFTSFAHRFADESADNEDGRSGSDEGNSRLGKMQHRGRPPVGFGLCDKSNHMHPAAFCKALPYTYRTMTYMGVGKTLRNS